MTIGPKNKSDFTTNQIRESLDRLIDQGYLQHHPEDIEKFERGELSRDELRIFLTDKRPPGYA